ncbi:MAG: hypothetical protein WEF86_01265 [Gemmatimonadota bacterium]
MRKVFAFLGATIGGWAGWYAGAVVSMTAAFLLGMVCTGLGMYIGIRLSQQYS